MVRMMAHNIRRKVRDCIHALFIVLAQAISVIHLAGFVTPFWRNTLLFSVLVVGFYKFAPAPGEELYLTQYLAHFKPSRDAWANINEGHVLDVTTMSEGMLLQASAQRPKAHRFRYPQ
jgi:hypothetical protein